MEDAKWTKPASTTSSGARCMKRSPALTGFGGGTATVKLFGRINDTFAWKQIQLWTSEDNAIEVVLFPEMRGEVTAYTSGTISLAIVGGA